MTKLKDKVQNALDEARLLILGAQVLIGLQYRAAFENGFERLPHHAQFLKLLSLTIMLITLLLIVWPGAYHRVVTRGEDSEELHKFTTRVMEIALVPFGLGLGIELFVVVEKVAGVAIGVAAGLLTWVMALIFWYGIEAIAKGKHTEHESMKDERKKPRRTKLRDKIDQVLTETRVVLPGAQALLGFQFVTILTEQFEKLPASSKYVHLASLCLIAACIILLMTTPSYHRIVERGEESEHFHRFASRILLASMAPLALGVCGDFFVVARKVTESTEFALGAAVTLLVLFCGIWFGTTLFWRNRREHETRWATQHGEHQPASGS
jgi:hypothetical protein